MLRIKDFKEFSKNPKKGDYTKLTILTFKDGIPKINKIDIYNWDGLLGFEERVEILKIPLGSI